MNMMRVDLVLCTENAFKKRVCVFLFISSYGAILFFCFVVIDVLDLCEMVLLVGM